MKHRSLAGCISEPKWLDSGINNPILHRVSSDFPDRIMDIPADIRREGRVVGLNVHGAVPARSCRNGFFWPNHMGGQALLWEIFRIQWDNEISVASL